MRFHAKRVAVAEINLASIEKTLRYLAGALLDVNKPGEDTCELHVTAYFIDRWNREKLGPIGTEFFRVSSINSLIRNITLYTKESLAGYLTQY